MKRAINVKRNQLAISVLSFSKESQIKPHRHTVVFLGHEVLHHRNLILSAFQSLTVKLHFNKKNFPLPLHADVKSRMFHFPLLLYNGIILKGISY